MTTNTQIHMPDRKSGTRYVWLTRYETETGSDLGSNDATGCTKNFPRTFIPMEELEESMFEA